MESELIQRVTEVLKDSGLTESAFAKSLVLEQKTVNNYINGKRAVGKDVLLKIWSVEGAKGLVEMAQDVSLLQFCLAGIILADIYALEHKNFDGDYLTYNRSKTKDKRKDKAKMIIFVPTRIRHLFTKYKGTDKLFNFSEKYAEEANFVKAVNKGLAELSDLAGVKRVTSYVIRHSCGTLAQNKCGASTEQVGFYLNHASAHKTTEGYINKDFTPVDTLNAKVINYVFRQRHLVAGYKRKSRTSQPG